MFHKAWRNGVNAGVRDDMPFFIQRSVRAMNTIAIALSPLSLIIGILIAEFYPYNPIAFGASAFVAVALMGIPFFNSKGFYHVSRFIWTSTLGISITIHIYLYGEGTGLEFGFLAVQASIFVFGGNLREINLHTILLLIALFVCSYIFYIQGKDENLLVYNVIAVSCMGAIYLHLLVLRLENEKYAAAIHEKNNNLQVQAETLALQNQEIQAQAEEIQSQSDQLRLKNEVLEEKNIRLEELNREKDGLIGIVAHDLRSPLTRTKGLVTLLHHNLCPQEKKEITDKLIKVTDDGLRLIRDILDVNALEMEQYDTQLTLLNIRKFIHEDLLSSFQEMASLKNIHFQILIDGDPEIYTDMSAVKRIMDNLITNAIKFSPPNKIVVIHAKQEHDWVDISIQDYGPGFTEEDQKKMFRKFQRLSARPTAGETSNGLGLAIVKSLVDQLSGSIHVKSSPGLGTKFIIQLKSSPFKLKISK
jgi:signal transduction histidine kinase